MPIPQSKAWLVDGFCRFTTRMVRKNFTCLGVQFEHDQGSVVAQDRSMVFYVNHVGWWDPIVAMLLRKKYYSNHIFYAPIDSKALEAYGVFRKMGFYGLELESYAGASDFLKTSREILKDPRSSIWITPEGDFADCREHDRPFMPGLAHLAATSPHTTFVPLALEYPFWEEAKPMIAARFGKPMCFPKGTSKSECAQHVFESLRTTQKELARSVMRREFSEFEFLLPPRAQRQSWYDTLRASKAWFKGRNFDPSHGSVTRRKGRSEPPGAQ
jgi:1-acyl-sn-glycerol-3-phosphate acyltransferase